MYAEKKVLNSFILKMSLKWVKIALQNLCKNSIPLPSYMQKKVVREKNGKAKVADNFMN